MLPTIRYSGSCPCRRSHVLEVRSSENRPSVVTVTCECGHEPKLRPAELAVNTIRSTGLTAKQRDELFAVYDSEANRILETVVKNQRGVSLPPAQPRKLSSATPDVETWAWELPYSID